MTNPDIAFPGPADDDSDDVRWALETAGAMWSQGEAKDALRWLKKAADTASDEGADMRSLSLAKVAAELRGIVEQADDAAPPAEAPAPRAAPPRARPSAPMASSGEDKVSPPARRPLPPPPPKKDAPRKRALPAPKAKPPRKVDVEDTQDDDAPASNSRQPAKTVRMDRKPEDLAGAVRDAVAATAARAPTPTPTPTPTSTPTPAAKPTEAAAPPPSHSSLVDEPDRTDPMSVPAVSAAPESIGAPPASSPPPGSSIPAPRSAPYAPTRSEPPTSASDRQTLIKAISVAEIEAYRPPAVTPPPIEVGDAKVIHHQTVRVSIHPLQDQPGVFLTHILSRDEPPPPGTSEALLVALDPSIRLVNE